LEYSILNLNPGYDQWHIIQEKPAFKNVYRADKVLKVASGKGLNLSRLFHHLNFEGYECMNVSGGMIGSMIEHYSKEEGLNCLYHPIAEESRINFCIIDEVSGKVESYNDPGPMLSGAEVNDLLNYLKRYIDKRRNTAIVISGAPCRGFDIESFKTLLKHAFDCGSKIIVDVAGCWLEAATTYPIYILKVNREEFYEAFKLDAFIFTEKLKRFKETKRIDTLIVTDGANGCVAYDAFGNGYYGSMKGINGGIDAVGSGDSFLGGYLLMHAYGHSMEECITFANACGIANTFVYGPAMIHFAEIAEFEKYSKIIELRIGED